MIEERSLIEGDTPAHGARREEALSLLVVRAGHWQALWLIHPDGDFYQRHKRVETEEVRQKDRWRKEEPKGAVVILFYGSDMMVMVSCFIN